jgi:hypothetical protein
VVGFGRRTSYYFPAEIDRNCKRNIMIQTETGCLTNKNLENLYLDIKFLVVLILELSEVTQYDMK